MNFNKKITMALLFASGIISLPVLADIETTTVKTTTTPVPGGSETTTTRTVSKSVYPDSTTTVQTTAITPTGTAFVLPSSSTYFVIDPITGNAIGGYNPISGFTDLSLVHPGLVVINKESGRVVAGIDPSGKPIALTIIPALDPFVASIDAKRANIEAMITNCQAGGTVDPAEAGALRKELDRIATCEITAKQNDGVISYSEALQIAVDLNDLQDRLRPFMPATADTPLIAARILTTNGELVVMDDIDYRQAKMLQRIDDEYTAGRLSAQQVSTLKEQLNTVAALETKYKKDGVLSESNKHRLSTKLDIINTRLNQDVAIINEKRSRLGLKVN